MCYMLLLSTDSPADLSAHNDALITFSRQLPGLPEEQLLASPNRWFVGSRNECSSGFRHLHLTSVDLGFGEPEDWYPEEPEDLAATAKFIGIVRELVASGASVDCVDAWDHSDPPGIAGTVEVDLSRVGDRAFRFFERRRLVFHGGEPDAEAGSE
jgi:hypothetical protein